MKWVAPLALLLSLLTTLALVQNVPAAPVLDALVGTTTSELESFKRYGFYSNNRYWFFWSSGTNMVYSSSLNGQDWAAATTVRAVTLSVRLSIWYDGVNVYYTATSSSVIFYRKGLPDSSGVVTWVDAEQTAVAAVTDQSYVEPYIAVDTDSNPFISYQRTNASDGNVIAQVTRSTTSDTWTTAASHPFALRETLLNARTQLAPLPSGRMVTTYSSGLVSYAREWDGSAWGSETTLTSSTGYPVSLVSSNDLAVAVWNDDIAGGDIVGRRYVSSTWEAEFTAIPFLDPINAEEVCLGRSENGVFYAVVGTGTGVKRYRESTGTLGDQWASIDTRIREGTDTLGPPSCYYNSDTSGLLGVSYRETSPSPDQVLFSTIPIGPDEVSGGGGGVISRFALPLTTTIIVAGAVGLLVSVFRRRR